MITIREMQIDDLEQVMPIEEANFSIPWTETGFFTFLIRDDALFLVAEEDGEILGYLGILISFDESEMGCVIGAGAVVVKSTEPGGVYVGVPAWRREKGAAG